MNIQIPLFDSRKDHYIEFDTQTPIVVNVSGGKDSTALLLWVKAHYPLNSITALYSDTGFEHPGVEAYIRNITRQLEITLFVVSAKTTLLDLVQERGYKPFYRCRYCTGKLKEEPCDKFIRENFPLGKVVQCFGFRAEESPSRAKKQILSPYKNLCTHNREVLFYAPLLDWKTADVVELVEAEGFNLFPTYEYLSRLSCRYCFLACKRDIESTRLNDPEGYYQVQQVLEKIKSAGPANKVLQTTPKDAGQNLLFNS